MPTERRKSGAVAAPAIPRNRGAAVVRRPGTRARPVEPAMIPRNRDVAVAARLAGDRAGRDQRRFRGIRCAVVGRLPGTLAHSAGPAAILRNRCIRASRFWTQARWTGAAVIPRNRGVAVVRRPVDRARSAELTMIPRNRYVALTSVFGTRARSAWPTAIPRNRFIAVVSRFGRRSSWTVNRGDSAESFHRGGLSIRPRSSCVAVVRRPGTRARSAGPAVIPRNHRGAVTSRRGTSTSATDQSRFRGTVARWAFAGRGLGRAPHCRQARLRGPT
jgi:hypothetical protein